ncbi:ABC transporter permease subunit [Aquisphaera insulae]|uniref:ABC transporter permease subunit n=1 Tax=Aquisphaera insulae TaxID=2712864 RepID=UPI0013EB6361|nr:ABC transporter permease subunit [Aquisphaera insulae]
MVGRLWWKDARQLLPMWGIVAAFALCIDGIFVRYSPEEVRNGFLLGMALFWAALYACLAATAAFAGEREARTMTLLDTLPAPRREVWLAKSSFALATAAALGLFLFLCAGLAPDGWHRMAPDVVTPDGGRMLSTATYWPPWVVLGLGLLVLVVVIGNGLFWSSWMKNVLLAATLAIVTSILASPLSVSPVYAGQSRTIPVLASLAIAVVLTVASYLAFLRTGPPTRPLVAVREPSPRSRRSAVADAERTTAGLAMGRPAWGWSAASRIAWQAFREVRSVAPWLLLLGVVTPMFYQFFGVGQEVYGLWLLMNGIVALLVGLNAFGMETRAGTPRMLAGHGARPGVVWLVRLVLWVLPLLAIWTLGLVAYLWMTSDSFLARLNRVWSAPETSAVIILGALMIWLTPMAVGALSGMAFRRGIMAGAMAVLGFIILAVVVGGAISASLVGPWTMIAIPPTILAVSFLWRWDWLLERPGLGRWARLIGLGAAASVLLFAGYVAERAWNVPTLPPDVDAHLFAVRIPAAVPKAENAAEVYADSSRVLRLRAGRTISQVVIKENNKEQVLSSLAENADLLPFIRKAAAMPACQFVDISHRTPLSAMSGFPNMWNLRMLLADSARKRRADGDLKGAWEDIIAVFRMARQQSGVVPLFIAQSGQDAEQTALWLAMNWAADARQTPELLKAALDQFKEFQAIPDPADPYRAEAVMARNMDQLSSADFAVKVEDYLLSPEASRKEKVTPLKALYHDFLTTPWERTRFGRVIRLFLAGAIQDADRPVAQSERVAPWRSSPWNGLAVWTRGGRFLSGQQVADLIQWTPLAQKTLPYTHQYMMEVDANEVSRRALVQILGLRLYQARHDGKLPGSLDELLKEGILPELPADPFTWPHKPFGYVASDGQKLIPLEDLSLLSPSAVFQNRSTSGHRLLYSVGWDRVDGHAQDNGYWGGIPGDLIFPLADNVRPPK